MWRTHKGIILLLIAALFLRCGVVWFGTTLREHPDVLRYKDWARISFLHGFADTYTSDHLSFGTYPNNQPPGTLYALSSGYWGWLQSGKVLARMGVPIGSNDWVNVVLLQIFLRIPSIVSDLVIGWIIYVGLSKWTKKKHANLIGASAFLFNPAVIYNSAFWGQMDSVANVWFVLSMYLLLQKKIAWSAVSFAASLLVKSSLAIVVPLYGLFVAVQNKWRVKSIVLYKAIFLVVLMLGIFPVSHTPWSWYPQFVIGNVTGEMDNISAFAFNLWWVIFHPTIAMGSSMDLTRVVSIWLENSPLIQTMYGAFSLGSIAYAVSALFQLPLYGVAWKKLKDGELLKPVVAWSLVAALTIVCFLTLPKMHERYLYPAWAPLAMLVGLGVPVFWEFVILFVINFVNLLIVWHPMPFAPWVFDVMRDSTVQWMLAIITVVIGFWTVTKLLKLIYQRDSMATPARKRLSTSDGRRAIT